MKFEKFVRVLIIDRRDSVLIRRVNKVNRTREGTKETKEPDGGSNGVR